MTEGAVSEFAELANRCTGHMIRARGALSPDEVIARALADRGMRSWDELAGLLTADSRALEDLVAELAVKETYFFRAPEQYRCLLHHLTDRVTPPRLIAGLRSGRRPVIRGWSIGCATGEEAYSVAAVVRAAVRHPDAWDIEILATDLSEVALRTGRLGVYSRPRRPEYADDLLAMLDSCADRGDAAWLMSEDIRRLITFRRHNVIADVLPTGFDFVFCRNVMIYMSRDAQRELVARLWDAVAPGGLVFLGDAELLHIMPHRFETICLRDTIAYRRPLGCAGPVVSLHE